MARKATLDRADILFLLHSKSTDYQLISTVKNHLAGYDSSDMIGYEAIYLDTKTHPTTAQCGRLLP